MLTKAARDDKFIGESGMFAKVVQHDKFIGESGMFAKVVRDDKIVGMHSYSPGLVIPLWFKNSCLLSVTRDLLRREYRSAA